MENTQENSASQNPTPADENARQAADTTSTAQAAPAEAAATPQAAPNEAEAALAEAQATIVALKEDFLRAKAETENVRRRARKMSRRRTNSPSKTSPTTCCRSSTASKPRSPTVVGLAEGPRRRRTDAASAHRRAGEGPRHRAESCRREVRSASPSGHLDGAGRAGAEHRRHRAAKGLT